MFYHQISILLASVLEWETQDSVEAIAGIQQGLDDFNAGKFRSFDEYAAEQRQNSSQQAVGEKPEEPNAT
ncbi:hypothetical protein [Chamaesiphon sp. VAR_48_metabat_403]|uniref:hypothetical protein n=1 Tax=Chamaesiphon sp. VAR_48_metabat_403 TaxID=2964700 RepID=UPI00286DB2E4|nr:hypothetical protein [Chamaesiphon sp. VAR_48_metabat_403]